MKILHFYKTSKTETFGGIETFIDQLASGCSAKGANVDVLCLSENPTPKIIEMNGYKIHRVKLNFEIYSTAMSFEALKSFSRLAKKADIIHYQFPWPFMDLLHLLQRPNMPTIVSYQSDIVRQAKLFRVYRPLMNYFLRDVSAIIASSPNYVSSSKVLKDFLYKTKVIPIGIDRLSYPIDFSDRQSYWQEKIGGNFFLYLGALRYYKGLDILLEAAQNCNQKIIIAGDGPLRIQLQQKAFHLGLKNVIFLGKVTEIDKCALLNLCRAFVFPSNMRSEAFGVSILEAFMFKKPAITCNIGTGTSYINIDGSTGIEIPPNDPTTLSNAIGYLARHPDICHEYGNNAYLRYKQYFSSEMMVNSYMEAYSSLLTKGSIYSDS